MSTNIPESSKMGEQFENYLRCHIFVKKYYVILENTHDFQANQGDFIESSINPDFKLRDKMNKSFYLEARYRSNDFDDKINWCNHGQLKRYQEFDKILPVFIAIALGGKPDNPQNLFLLPLHEANDPDLLLTTAFKYQIPLGKPVIPEDLWKLVQPPYRKAG
jgi:hypothetical protein